MSIFADHDPQERMCTGAYDPHRDGCPDTWGWVADMVDTGNGKPSLLLCPSNPLKGQEKLNDLVGQTTSNGGSWVQDPTCITAGQCQYLYAGRPYERPRWRHRDSRGQHRRLGAAALR